MQSDNSNTDIQYKKVKDKINDVKKNLENIYNDNYKGGNKLNATAIQYENYFKENHKEKLDQLKVLKNILKYLENLKTNSKLYSVSKEEINSDIKNIKYKISELNNHSHVKKN